jgi:hypothetical protein
MALKKKWAYNLNYKGLQPMTDISNSQLISGGAKPTKTQKITLLKCWLEGQGDT